MKAGEDKLVQHIAKTVTFKSSRPLALGLGDDAALLAPRSGSETILTSDWFLEGRHFLPEKHPADSVGWKCLARAVSDVAAMGGQPRCFLLSLALPGHAAFDEKGRQSRWLDEFLGGLRRAASQLNCELAGGDTTESSHILISVTVVGEVLAGRAVRRSGAKAGDKVFLSGTLGEAELGLRKLRYGTRISPKNESAVQKYLYPQPRLALGQWLANRKLASSMMDISDGLSSDLPRLCAASRVGARIEAVNIPLPNVPLTTSKVRYDPLTLALNGGDDYELLFTVSEKNARRIPRSFQGLALTQIGEITRERRILLVQNRGVSKRLLPGGWDPFRK
jgi:thiamine-monophosphate kinase